jgi:hypothetical protein
MPPEGDCYLYPGTTALKNILGVRHPDALAQAQDERSAARQPGCERWQSPWPAAKSLTRCCDSLDTETTAGWFRWSFHPGQQPRSAYVQSLHHPGHSGFGRSDRGRGQPRLDRSDGCDRLGTEEDRQVHAAELRHIHRPQDQGAQGPEPAYRRVHQGEGRQDRPLQGVAHAQKGRLIRPMACVAASRLPDPHFLVLSAV